MKRESHFGGVAAAQLETVVGGLRTSLLS